MLNLNINESFFLWINGKENTFVVKGIDRDHKDYITYFCQQRNDPPEVKRYIVALKEGSTKKKHDFSDFRPTAAMHTHFLYLILPDFPDTEVKLPKNISVFRLPGQSDILQPPNITNVILRESGGSR